MRHCKRGHSLTFIRKLNTLLDAAAQLLNESCHVCCLKLIHAAYWQELLYQPHDTSCRKPINGPDPEQHDCSTHHMFTSVSCSCVCRSAVLVQSTKQQGLAYRNAILVQSERAGKEG